jgi:outer membrane receptor protein involved in Fe transport
MSPANARQAGVNYHIPPQPLDRALNEFGLQSGSTMMVDAALLQGIRTAGFDGVANPEQALTALLRNTALSYRHSGNVFVVRPVAAAATGDGAAGKAMLRPAAVEQATPPASPPPPGGPKGHASGNVQAATAVAADPEQIQEIIVTAQKRAESIQKVPIAISAFTAKNLDEYKIEGGAELLRAIPNVNFSKSNFTGYNFSIRGVGTKAVSVTTDPAVAVSFNNTPLIRNRLFEQEYLDVERVEVLRGPQGTLYGRNATGGVVNMISAKPTDKFEGEVEGEVGNYDSRRLRGMINIPITDTFAIRAAGSYTNRSGFDYNSVTDSDVDGRKLWSGRVTLGWKPSPDFNATLIWEHFGEHDDRARTGKQLCTPDAGPTMIGDTPVPDALRPELSQGCKPGSLYDAAAYGVPNGLSQPFVQAAAGAVSIGFDGPFGNSVPLINPNVDPYAGVTQSRDLRTIATAIDPRFRARNDVIQLNLDMGVAPGLRAYSQTLYTEDHYYSLQDYNRFNSNPVFNDSNNATDFFGSPLVGGLTPGGVFTDPQLGPSNRILSADVTKSRSTQWTQEVRLQSSFSGPINFSVGANYLHFHVNEDYYVFNNLFTALAEGLFNGGNTIPFGGSIADCPPGDTSGCVYIDPNPINKINGQGHNYFRSHNLYSVDSYAAFGEAYWRIRDNLKLTAGLRWTDDQKTTTPIPSQLLLAPGQVGGGFENAGYPEDPDIKQSWKKVTGRFALDWTPRLSFTDSTLFYASFSRGYKGGGTNSPGIDANPEVFQFQAQPSTFKPEYLNAFEIGTKNTLDGGRITLNASAFYYDYKNYQISKIIDRAAVNENFNAHTWGFEMEATWRPVPRLRLNANLGYLGTRLASGSKSIDVMNRTQGNPDYVEVRPWVQLTSNCIAPRDKVEKILANPFSPAVALAALCGGAGQFGNFQPGSFFSQLYGFTYNPLTDAPNGGQGIAADVGGNELPNAPHWTFNIGAQYGFEVDSWEVTPRIDFYVQSASWARIYNTPYDRLKSWSNTNISLTFEEKRSQFTMQLYVKNLFNKSPITDAFTNSDDSGLTTNVFTLDPRIIGLSLKKRF